MIQRVCSTLKFLVIFLCWSSNKNIYNLLWVLKTNCKRKKDILCKKKQFEKIQHLIKYIGMYFITYAMITRTSSLSSDKGLLSGTHPFKKVFAIQCGFITNGTPFIS